jgi:hypothetical protein
LFYIHPVHLRKEFMNLFSQVFETSSKSFFFFLVNSRILNLIIIGLSVLELIHAYCGRWSYSTSHHLHMNSHYFSHHDIMPKQVWDERPTVHKTPSATHRPEGFQLLGNADGDLVFSVPIRTANLIPQFAVYQGLLSVKFHYNIQQRAHYIFNGGFPDCGLGCSSVIAHKWIVRRYLPWHAAESRA